MGFAVGDFRQMNVIYSEELVQKFAEMSGDFNPIHMSEDYAKNTRFKTRIAHGMISAALISRMLVAEFGEGGIYLSQNLKFLIPIYVGQEVVIEILVLTRRQNGLGQIQTNVKNLAGEICVKGEAMIMDNTFV